MAISDVQTSERFNRAIHDAVEGFEKNIDALAATCITAFPPASAKSQISHLERIARAAPRLGDVIVYVKRQTGKDAGKKEHWARRTGDKPSVGEQLVEFLEKVRLTADAAAQRGGLQDHKNELRVKIAAKCLRNLSSSYLYKAAI